MKTEDNLGRLEHNSFPDDKHHDAGVVLGRIPATGGLDMSFPSNAMEQSDPLLRVLVADDHERVLESARSLLGSDYQVVAAVNDGLMAVEGARKLNPDLIVMDIEMPRMDGIRAAQEMRRLGSKARILFLSVHDEEDYIAAARRFGDGYVLKSRMGTDLRHAIDEALSGRFFVSHRTR